jgi:hypothetical protein
LKAQRGEQERKAAKTLLGGKAPDPTSVEVTPDARERLLGLGGDYLRRFRLHVKPRDPQELHPFSLDLAMPE